MREAERVLWRVRGIRLAAADVYGTTVAVHPRHGDVPGEHVPERGQPVAVGGAAGVPEVVPAHCREDAHAAGGGRGEADLVRCAAAGQPRSDAVRGVCGAGVAHGGRPQRGRAVAQLRQGAPAVQSVAGGGVECVFARLWEGWERVRPGAAGARDSGAGEDPRGGQEDDVCDGEEVGAGQEEAARHGAEAVATVGRETRVDRALVQPRMSIYYTQIVIAIVLSIIN